MVTRKFEIELDVPDDFDEKYGAPYLMYQRCVVRDGIIVWSVYADPKEPEPQWRKATHNDEGNCNARFRDFDTHEWITGKLLHYQPSFTRLRYLGFVKPVRGDDDRQAPIWFAECEVPV